MIYYQNQLARNTKGVIEKYISARYLLFTSLHGAIAKVMNKEHMVKNNHGVIFEPQPESEFVFKCDRFTYWWSLYINTATKVPHSKPDSVIWNKEVKTWSIIEFSCSVYVEITKRVDGTNPASDKIHQEILLSYSISNITK